MKDIDSDSRSSKSRWTLWVVLAVCLLIPTTSRADLFSTEKLELFADFRARAEADGWRFVARSEGDGFAVTDVRSGEGFRAGDLAELAGRAP